MKPLVWTFLLVAAIPLLVWPFILAANIMSLAAHEPAKPVPLALRLASRGFLWGSTLYPLAYGLCAAGVYALSRAGRLWLALFVSFVPYVYLCIVAALFSTWFVLGVK